MDVSQFVFNLKGIFFIVSLKRANLFYSRIISGNTIFIYEKFGVNFIWYGLISEIVVPQRPQRLLNKLFRSIELRVYE
ncbi:MAG: hypothetical protein LBL02_01235 [Endomicrobium sp.]|nr:hypothetical protein [Endomicrobium sp.]